MHLGWVASPSSEIPSAGHARRASSLPSSRWRAPWLAVCLVALVASTSASRASAQASDLASPWRGSASAATVAPPTSASTTTASPSAAGLAPTDVLDGDLVPPPPGAYGATANGDGWGAPGLRLRSSISTRLRSLDADLQILALRGGGSVVDGVLAIVMGAASITVGIVMDAEGSGTMSPYLYVYGGAGIARGILNFVFLQNPSGVAVTYSHMPMTTLPEVRARLRYGESELESLASNAQTARIVDGALSIATGLAVIPIYLGPRNFEITEAYDYFVLIGAAISAVTGTVTLLSSTEAERRWNAYRDLRDRLLATEQGAEDEAEVEAAREQLQAFEREAAAPSFSPTLAGGGGALLVGATGTF